MKIRNMKQVGGGVKGGAFKAVQIGGPSGGCLCISATEDHLDMKLDFDSLYQRENS